MKPLLRSVAPGSSAAGELPTSGGAGLWSDMACGAPNQHCRDARPAPWRGRHPDRVTLLVASICHGLMRARHVSTHTPPGARHLVEEDRRPETSCTHSPPWAAVTEPER